MSTKTMKEKATELLQRCEVVVLASVNKEGYPRPVPMSKIATEGISTIWMSTGADSLKTIDFRKNRSLNGNCRSGNGRENEKGTLAGLVYRAFPQWPYRPGLCTAEI